jgi:6-phosphogluconate dehydrogenase
MAKAGGPVDGVTNQLASLLEPDNIIIHGGNSLWSGTQRRERTLKDRRIHFFGVEVSRGEEGALKGLPSQPNP